MDSPWLPGPVPQDAGPPPYHRLPRLRVWTWRRVLAVAAGKAQDQDQDQDQVQVQAQARGQESVARMAQARHPDRDW